MINLKTYIYLFTFLTFTIFNFTNTQNSLDELSKSKQILEYFQKFVLKNKKTYTSINEFNERFNNFKVNFAELNEENLDKFSKFMDLSKEEFKNKYLTFKIKDLPVYKDDLKDDDKRFLQSDDNQISFDWRDKGIVTAVKDQGECGCCWAFSAVGNIEALYAIKFNKKLDLSEKQLLDCDNVNDGCDGGAMEDAYKYIIDTKGLMKEGDYPYSESKGRCNYKPQKAIVQIDSWINANTKNEEKIKNLLVKNGPLSAAVNADNLQLYRGGIIDESQKVCPQEKINHAIIIVGYGEQNGKKYWIVKNSWGSDWGEKGYFRIARGKGTCGINTYVVSAVLG